MHQFLLLTAPILAAISLRMVSTPKVRISALTAGYLMHFYKVFAFCFACFPASGPLLVNQTILTSLLVHGGNLNMK